MSSPSILQQVNVVDAVAVGAVSATAYYFLIDSSTDSNLNFMTVGLATGLASAVSDFLANMSQVRSLLGDMLSTYLKPVLVGAVGSLFVMGAGGDVFGSLQNAAIVFGFGFGSKIVGDYVADMYASRWGNPGYNPASKNDDKPPVNSIINNGK
jgi:hypothetical protein